MEEAYSPCWEERPLYIDECREDLDTRWATTLHFTPCPRQLWSLVLELFVEVFSPDLQTRIRRMIDCGEATEQARGKPGGKAVGEQDQVGDGR